VDKSDSKYIDSPYGSQPSTTIQTIAGTYSVDSYTLSDDTLTVTDEFIVAEHIYDWEKVLTSFDLMASRIDEQNYSVAASMDSWVLNNLCEDGTGTYTTPSGGFTTPANIIKILADLLGKFTGYADTYKGLYLVIESTDVTGFAQAQAANGYKMADSALKNGFFTHYMGFDIYVVQSGVFVSTTLGTKAVTNDGHRVAGVKGITTFAFPRDLQYEEKPVTGKTGREVVTWGYLGFKAWYSKLALTIDITLTA